MKLFEIPDDSGGRASGGSEWATSETAAHRIALDRARQDYEDALQAFRDEMIETRPRFCDYRRGGAFYPAIHAWEFTMSKKGVCALLNRMMN